MENSKPLPLGPLEEFCGSLAANRAVHAYLVIGARGSGKHRFATEAARSVLCRDRTRDGQYCGVCGVCARTAAGSHPDWFDVRLPDKKASIGVEEIRGALEKLAVSAYEGGARVVIVHDAEKMTTQAQNALLKSLEEPGAEVTWFLLASDASLILSTILSRCRQVRILPSLGAADALASMGADDAYAREIDALSEGAMERARELYQSASFRQAREKALTMLSVRGGGRVPALWQSIKEDKDLAQEILLWLEGIAADGLRVSCGLQAKMVVTEKINDFTFSQWQGIINEIMQIRKKLGSNVPWNVAAEPLLWKIAEGESE